NVVAELSGILQRILINVGDPAPGDLARVVEQITEQLVAQPLAADELTQALAQLDQLSAAQIQTALVGAQARMQRLQGATALLSAALKQAQTQG
ncbi:MAG TPA: hypothetical protein VKU44_02055, partial [Terriglobia bacterium]|nr:hypothetical protein [Terriglobia bacterium]